MPNYEAEIAATHALNLAASILEPAYRFGPDRREEKILISIKAARTSPQCSDALVLLAAETEAGSDAEHELLSRAVIAAGERYQPREFEQYASHTRGRFYFRAMRDFAICLWNRGKRQEACNMLLTLMKIDGSDNAGIRFILIPWLVILGGEKRRQNIRGLLQRFGREGFQDTTGRWAWTALLGRVASGDFRVHDSLRWALTANSRVFSQLMANAANVSLTCNYRCSIFNSVANDTVSEADLVVAQTLEAWASVPGGLKWLQQSVN